MSGDLIAIAFIVLCCAAFFVGACIDDWRAR